MKIYTKTGDDGSTMLLGGGRVSKAHLRIDAYGTVDELNSYVGLIRDQKIQVGHKVVLKKIQDTLFVLGATLATNPDKKKVKSPDITDEDVVFLEHQMDAMNAELPDLKHFILPGGHTTVSYCHLARCVCRRTERLVVYLAQTDEVAPIVIHYLNRLSDYFFVLSRKIGAELEVDEIIWNPR